MKGTTIRWMRTKRTIIDDPIQQWRTNPLAIATEPTLKGHQGGVLLDHEHTAYSP